MLHSASSKDKNLALASPRMQANEQFDALYLESSAKILGAIKKLLTDKEISFKEFHHEAVFTSEDACRARGEELRKGGKAIIMKVGCDFRLFVLPADKKIDSKKILHRYGVKRARFASLQELRDITGLVPGCIPPFGKPILALEMDLDVGILENSTIIFNAGSLTDSIELRMEDYLKVAEIHEKYDFSA